VRPNDHQAATAHIADKSFVERATTALLLGLLWSGLATCILGALSYDIVVSRLARLALVGTAA
jgi:hypothetical protein